MLKDMRLERGWTQEDLAHFTGLNVKSIQRIEKGQNPSLESLKALASVFETDINTIKEQLKMTYETNLTSVEQQTLKEIKKLRKFYIKLATAIMLCLFLFIVNFFVSPSYYWVWWVVFGFAIGLSRQAIDIVINQTFFSKDWEKKQLEKKLGKKI